jgi:hypothetical protein
MKRTFLLSLLVFALAAFAFAPAFAPAYAGPPCDDLGLPGNSDYAQGHIVPLAKAGLLGRAHAHFPGVHQGFSVCK